MPDPKGPRDAAPDPQDTSMPARGGGSTYGRERGGGGESGAYGGHDDGAKDGTPDGATKGAGRTSNPDGSPESDKGPQTSSGAPGELAGH